MNFHVKLIEIGISKISFSKFQMKYSHMQQLIVAEHNCEAYLFRLHKNNEGNFIPLSQLLLFLSFLPRSTFVALHSVLSLVRSLNQTFTLCWICVVYDVYNVFYTLVFIYPSNAFEEIFTYTYRTKTLRI